MLRISKRNDNPLLSNLTNTTLHTFFVFSSSTVGLSCVGKFRCGSSSQCVSTMAQCDGTMDCENHEDELGCGEIHWYQDTFPVSAAETRFTCCILFPSLSGVKSDQTFSILDKQGLLA